MKQKFPIHSFVKVSKKMPPYMAHFQCGFVGIVQGTYSQLYGGTDVKQYSIYVIKRGKVVECISWYEEDQLTLEGKQNKRKAAKMVEQYNFRNQPA